MKRLIVGILSSLALMVPVLVITAPVVEASTVIDGCASGATLKSSGPWTVTKTTWSANFDPLLPLWTTQKWRHEAYMIYWFCPRGDLTDKVKFRWLTYCVTKKDNNEALNMRGFKWNAYIGNNFGEVTDPPEASRDWMLGAGNDGDKRCYKQDFTDSSWLYRSSDPYWKFDSWVVLALQADDHIEFKWPSDTGDKHWLGYGADDTVDVGF